LPFLLLETPEIIYPLLVRYLTCEADVSKAGKGGKEFEIARRKRHVKY